MSFEGFALAFLEVAAVAAVTPAALFIAGLVFGTDRVDRFIEFIGFGDEPAYREGE